MEGTHIFYSVSSIVPLALLSISIPVHIIKFIKNRRLKLSDTEWSKFNITTVLLTSTFLLLNILLSLTEQCWNLRIVIVCLAVFTTVFKVGSLVLVIKSESFTSKTFFVFWILTTTVCTVNILSYATGDSINDPYKLVAICVNLVISVTLIIFQWFTYKEGNVGEEEASFVSVLLFHWLDYLFIKGFNKKIDFIDLPELPEMMNVQKIIKTFQKNYNQQTEGIKVLIFPLLKSFGAKFIVGSVLKAVNDVFLFIGPLILRKLLNVMENGGSASRGYFWCVLLFLSSLVMYIVSNQQFRVMYQVGFQMRTAVMSAIFKKSLRLSPSARQEWSGGEITNLLAIDSQRLVEVIRNVHVLWSAPFQIALALYFLYDIVGTSAFAGMAILLTLVPANVIGSYFGKKIQTSQMNFKDQRMLKLNEIIQGIKVIKYYAWEKPFMSIVNKIRDSEIRTIKQYSLVYSMLNVTFTVVPLGVTLATFTVYIYSDPENNILTAEKVFSCIAIFNVLRIPLFLFPMFFMEAIKLFVSLRRISKFLHSPEIDSQYISQDSKGNTSFKINEGNFDWKLTSLAPSVLKNISVEAKKGELIAVIGKVGSGKSSLLASLMGDMKCLSGSVKVSSDSWSYVSQQAWIQNMTLKENILFGTSERKEFYEKVIEACALTSDLKILPAGDETEIGENGINLSGGQKQRVALARAAYRDSEVYLLDDPLSAVDAHVAKHLFDSLLGPNGLLKTATKVLVTHNLSFLDKMDSIILIDDGEIVLSGSYDTIKKNEIFLEFTKTVSQGKSDKDEVGEVEENTNERTKSRDDEKLIEEEGMQDGRVSLKNYLHYIKLINSWIFFLIVSLYGVGEALMVGCNLVLAEWTDKVAVKTLTLDEHLQYILFYGGLNIAVCLVSVVYNIWTYFAMTKPSKKMHKSVLDRTMHAPLSFFESNPSGRVLNRFTSDIEVIDRKIPFELADVIYCTINFIAVLITVSAIVPYILIAVGPILAGYVLLQMLMTRTRCQIKRLESVAKSPIISHFSEAIAGASTIRAFGEEARFVDEFETKIEKHLKANYITDMMSRWLTIRVDMLGNSLVFLVAIITFTLRDSLSSGLAGIAITYSMMVLDSLGWNIRMVCELENDSVSIERIREYETIDQEGEWEINDVPSNWPKNAELTVENVDAKYRENLPNCLENLSLQLSPGEKLGVCGRTGAGKSSLASLLLRIIQPHKGIIKLGGINTSHVGLQQLRSKITIVPQVHLDY